MAKISKYSDEMLLDAVIKYSETTASKIQAKQLAEWARENVLGLEEVRDYHFLRPKKEKGKSGQINEITRPCTMKIREINEERKLKPYSKNILLQSSDIGAFRTLPLGEQREQIMKTRSLVESLVKENKIMKEKCDLALGKVNVLQSDLASAAAKIKELTRSYNEVVTDYKRLLKIVDKRLGKETLETIGLIDGDIDIEMFKKSRVEFVNDSFNIKKVITSDTMLEGIDF